MLEEWYAGDAVGSKQARIASLLESLERANLFVIALDQQRSWYRYHRLFADVLASYLRQELPEREALLHERASVWFEQRALFPEAITHALQAKAFARAAQLVSANGLDAILRGESATVTRWPDAIPTDLWEQEPRLFLLRGVMLSAFSDYAGADAILVHAQTVIEKSPEHDTPALRAEIVAHRALAASLLLDPNALALVQEALQQLPADHRMRNVMSVASGYAYYSAGELATAQTILEQMLIYVENDPNAYTVRTGLSSTLILVLLARGQYRAAAARAEHIRQGIEENPLSLPSSTSLLYGELGLLAYEANALTEAEKYLERAIAIAQENRGYASELFAWSNLAYVADALGDSVRADVAMHHAANITQQYQPASANHARLTGRRALLWVQQKNFPAVEQWAREVPLFSPRPRMSPFDHDRFVQVHLLLAHRAWDDALTLLDELQAAAQATRHGIFLIDALLLRAITYQAMGRLAQTLEPLSEALTLAEPEGLIRTFLDKGDALRDLLLAQRNHIAKQSPQIVPYLNTLLDAFHVLTPMAVPAAQSFQHASLVEPISQRELEVLQFIAQGLSNQEIADKMVVAVATVKKHINNLYAKLRVESRTQALVRGRELGILA